MDKFLEIVKARSKRTIHNTRLNEVMIKAVENVVCEMTGKPLMHNYDELFAEITAIKAEMTESTSGLSDAAALIATELFEEWNPNKAYNKGDRFMWKGNLYRAKKETVINPTWTPDVVHEYYEPISKASEEGTLENPITAVAGMQYEKGKYYSEGDKVYICTRSELLHYIPSALVGIYFEEVTR